MKTAFLLLTLLVGILGYSDGSKASVSEKSQRISRFLQNLADLEKRKPDFDVEKRKAASDNYKRTMSPDKKSLLDMTDVEEHNQSNLYRLLQNMADMAKRVAVPDEKKRTAVPDYYKRTRTPDKKSLLDMADVEKHKRINQIAPNVADNMEYAQHQYARTMPPYKKSLLDMADVEKHKRINQIAPNIADNMEYAQHQYARTMPPYKKSLLDMADVEKHKRIDQIASNVADNMEYAQHQYTRTKPPYKKSLLDMADVEKHKRIDQIASNIADNMEYAQHQYARTKPPYKKSLLDMADVEKHKRINQIAPNVADNMEYAQHQYARTKPPYKKSLLDMADVEKHKRIDQIASNIADNMEYAQHQYARTKPPYKKSLLDMADVEKHKRINQIAPNVADNMEYAQHQYARTKPPYKKSLLDMADVEKYKRIDQIASNIADKKIARNQERSNEDATSEDPTWLNMEELFAFPGSWFVENLFTLMLEEGIPNNLTTPNEWTWAGLEDLQELMFDMYNAFGDWTGIPDFVTRKLTQWVAETKFACPSLIFDKIFAIWVYERLDDEFESMGGSLNDTIMTATMAFFPNKSVSWCHEVTAAATDEVVTWMAEELWINFFGPSVMDIAGFSYVAYYGLLYNFDAYTPDTLPSNLLETIMDFSLDIVPIECETKEEMLAQRSYGMAMLNYKFEKLDDRYWMMVVEDFFRTQFPEEVYEGFCFDEYHLMLVGSKLKDYMWAIKDVVAEYEYKLESTNLGDFLYEVLGDGYSDLITDLVTEMDSSEKRSNNNLEGLPPARKRGYM